MQASDGIASTLRCPHAGHVSVQVDPSVAIGGVKPWLLAALVPQSIAPSPFRPTSKRETGRRRRVHSGSIYRRQTPTLRGRHAVLPCGRKRRESLPAAVPSCSPLDQSGHFDDYGTMKTTTAVRSLAALAQESRLLVFRLLVQQGPEGMHPSDISARLKVSPATLSFHLKELANAGLIRAQPEGRHIRYSADFKSMNALLDYLTENCRVQRRQSSEGPGASQ